MGGCGSVMMKPCLSETDIRYDANFPKTIMERDPRWEQLAGYFRINATTFDAKNGVVKQPSPYIPGIAPTVYGPTGGGNRIAFYNHTIDGSRMIFNRYYFAPPAEESFCQIPLEPPALNAAPGSTCGENGISWFGALYASLNHENDGTLTIARTAGTYAMPGPTSDPGVGNIITLVDDNTFEFTFLMKDVFSNVQSFVFFDDINAAVGTVNTRPQQKMISQTVTAKMVRLTEDEFLGGIQEYTEKFNVPADYQKQAPMTSNEILGLEGTFPTEEEWCGGITNDVSCTPSPYQEPDTKMKGGFIAMFVVIGVLIFGTAAFVLHRNITNKQKKRFKKHFVRGIARNITIAPSAGMIDAEQLKKEFDHIDKDKGGTISKEELKEFLASGKVGDLSDKDFEAMWSALDIDCSGEVDFVVRAKLDLNCVLF